DLTVSSPEWHPDGDRIAFAGSDPENGYVPTQAYCWEDGEYESLTADLDRTLSWGAALRWVGEDVVTTIGDEAHVRFVRAHMDGSAERVFVGRGEYRTVQAFDIAANTLVALRSHPADGRDLHATSIDELDASDESDTSSKSVEGSKAEDDPFRRLTAVNDDLIETYPMPNCKRVRYKSD